MEGFGSQFSAIFAALEISIGAILISFPRGLGFVTFFVPFAWAGCNRGIMRFGVAAIFALPMTQTIVGGRPLVPSMDTAVVWILLSFKEALLGIALALLMSTPFWAAQLAGATLSIVRTETGDGAPNIGETPLARTMLAIVICAFVFSNGFARTLDIFFISHEVWPIDVMRPEGFALDTDALRMLTVSLLSFTISILMPFLIVITLFELGIAFSGRFMKRLQASSLALDMRSLIILIMLTLSVGLLVERSTEMLGQTFDAIVGLLRLAGSAP